MRPWILTANVPVERAKVKWEASLLSRNPSVQPALALSDHGADERPDTRADRLNVLSGVDDPNPFWLGAGDGTKPALHTFEEGPIGLLHPVAERFAEGPLQITTPGIGIRRTIEPSRLPRVPPRFADFDGHLQEQRQLGPRVADGKIDHRLDHRQIQLAPVTLIGGGRVVEAIAENDLARGQGGSNHLPDQLGATGVHQQQLRLRHHRMVGLTVLEGVTNLFADRRATRLAQDPYHAPQRAQSIGQELNLSRFASAFRAFERDEDSIHESDSIRNQSPAPAFADRPSTRGGGANQ